jgi:hypothetical protein
VNTALIELYWQIGQIISGKFAQTERGNGLMTQLAEQLASTWPG